MKVLERLAPPAHPWIDPSTGRFEDAALVRPPDGPALAFTVDFITPIVDDPGTFGAIAAANALSDVYAMGGEPRVALAICGFPEDRVPLDVVEAIFRGGAAKAAEAGCVVAGGHTVLDPELKYGLCVLGELLVEPPWTQTGARPGDRLVLTKPLGTGILAQAAKRDAAPPEAVETLARVASTLNRPARDAGLAAGVRAATDVTGFGLLGHLRQLAEASGLRAAVDPDAVPILPHARELAAKGFVPGGTRRNERYVAPWLEGAEALDPVTRALLCDAQTSGGLLLAVPEDRVGDLVEGLRARAVPAAAEIGRLEPGPAGRIRFARGAGGVTSARRRTARRRRAWKRSPREAGRQRLASSSRRASRRSRASSSQEPTIAVTFG